MFGDRFSDRSLELTMDKTVLVGMDSKKVL